MPKYQWTCPCPTTYPAAEVQCCIDCANGVCNEPLEDKIHAHNVVIDYATQQAVANGPCPCPPCTIKDVEAAHAAFTSGQKAAVPAIFLVLLQLFGPALQALIAQLLSQLNPPKPTP